MSKQLVKKVIEELEQLPMEGGNSQSDRSIQEFLDHLYEMLEGEE